MSDDEQIERVINKGTFDDKTACGSACDLCVVFPTRGLLHYNDFDHHSII